MVQSRIVVRTHENRWATAEYTLAPFSYFRVVRVFRGFILLANESLVPRVNVVTGRLCLARFIHGLPTAVFRLNPPSISGKV